MGSGSATFTKWLVGEGPEMVGAAGGVVGDGTFSGRVLELEPGETTVIRAVYRLTGSAVLLGTGFRDWGPVSSEVRTWFLAGYQSVNPLGRTESYWWDVLVAWSSLGMVPAGEDPTGWRSEALSQLSWPSVRT